MENKQKICDLLCEALKATRNHADIREMTFDPEHEIVTIEWEGGRKNINVAFDSGTAMIRDIMRAIE